MTKSLKLCIWTATGELVLDRRIDARTLSLSAFGDADLIVPALGDAAAFVRASLEGGSLHYHKPGQPELKAELLPGKAAEVGDLRWLLAFAEGDHDVMGEGGESWSALLTETMSALARPMASAVAVREALKVFLSVVVKTTPATSGMIVLAENGGGFNLVSSYGLAPGEATTLWEKMPQGLVEEVLRQNARVLLPDELKRRASGDTTVFVRGVRSVAGFPVLAEDRLVAIFFLGFDNLLRRLSPELQAALEAAATALGLVIQRAELREQVQHLTLTAQSPAAGAMPPDRLMVGQSERLAEVYHLIGRLAPVDVPTLITGETGTGKELGAKELHRLSARGRRPFVVVNAAALPESLIESELFGHRRGAFTGALSDRVGLVEQADGGTLFIDELGELPLAMQSKLLRVLQERAVTRLGETQPRPVDFRLVCATHRTLAEMVAAGTFREDLFYRIAGAEIRMPSLRERIEDIPLLAEHFRKSFALRHGLPDKEWSQDALFALAENPWTGNVRELENVVSRAFVMAEGQVIQRRDLGAAGGALAPETTAVEASALITLNDARDVWLRNYLIQALKRHKGRRSDTAKALGIGERTLFRYIEQLDIRDA